MTIHNSDNLDGLFNNFDQKLESEIISCGGIGNDCNVTLHNYNYNRVELVNSPFNKVTKKRKAYIRRLSKERYINLDTGEIKECDHHNKKMKSTFSRSFNNIKELIYCNFTGDSNERFLTLTFSNQLGSKELHEDSYYQFYALYKKQVKKFMRKIRDEIYKKAGELVYITIMEPHLNKTPHFHLLLKAKKLDDFPISDSRIRDIWNSGFIKMENITNIDHLPAYFYPSLKELNQNNTSDTHQKFKKDIKGERLKYYPKKLQLFSCSRRLKRAETSHTYARKARQELKEDLKMRHEINEDSHYPAINENGDCLGLVRREVWKPFLKTSEAKYIRKWNCPPEYASLYNWSDN